MESDMGEILPKPQSPPIKYYDVETVIKMMPLIVSYCRDIEQAYNEFSSLHFFNKKLENLIGVNNEENLKIEDRKMEVKNEMLLVVDRLKRWREELTKLHISICSIKLGRINVPIYDDQTASVIILCMHKSINTSNLEWHCIRDTHEEAHPYWYELIKSKKLLISG